MTIDSSQSLWKHIAEKESCSREAKQSRNSGKRVDGFHAGLLVVSSFFNFEGGIHGT